MIDNNLKRYELSVAKKAIELGCSQAIYGHTHYPCIKKVDGILVANCGTWVRRTNRGYPVITAEMKNSNLQLQWVQRDGTISRR